MEKEFGFDAVPIIRTKAGKLKGYSYDGMNIYKGIPYARAGRFQMPVEVESWEGVKEVTSYGYVCPLLTQDHPTGELLVPHRYWPMEEDCLNLNIWTDSVDRNAKKPVLVWIHGGAYVAGSSIEQEAYDGFSMCRLGDVVVVSVNHRLNILGYLDLSPFGEKYAHSANAGHADLVAALRWIHENIENFGGDPENVTLFGQSGGGLKSTELMQIPAADGLFHKVFAMSGVSDGALIPVAKGNGRAIVTAMMKELGIPENEVERLETVPYRNLAEAYNKVSPSVARQGGYVGCVPMADDFYLGDPLVAGLTDHAKTIPLLIGSVFGEFSAFAPFPMNKYEMSVEQMAAVLTERYGERAGELIDAFTKAYPGKKPVDVLMIDRLCRKANKALAKMQAEAGKAPAYLYNFTLEFPYQNGKTAWHCADIPFVFHNTDRVEICGIPGVTEQLEEQMFRAVVSFARTGSPSHDGLPAWPAVTVEDETTMIFDRTSELRHNYDDELLKLVEEIAPPFSMAMLQDTDIQH